MTDKGKIQVIWKNRKGEIKETIIEGIQTVAFTTNKKWQIHRVEIIEPATNRK